MLLLVIAAACSPAARPPGAIPAPEPLVQRITAFLRPGYTITDAHVLRASSHSNATIFAARIVGATPEPAVGVWLIAGGLETPGTTLSIDTFAREFSTAPDGSTTDARTSMTDPGTRELQRYVESLLR